MEESKFKTNLKCDGCVAKVTPDLNETVGEGNWNVDLQDSQKILTVKSEASEEAILKALKKSGYQAEKV